MYTVGRLAKKHGFSRSTLLYYDAIGLLKPSVHAKGEYRQYSAADDHRLEQIVTYRKAGLPLKEIKRVLDAPATGLASALENRLDELSGEITALRDQQRFILTLLGSGSLPEDGLVDKHTWTGLLASAGFSEDDMRRWHAEFERRSPDKHLQFLRLLCIPEYEIDIIRSWAAAPHRMSKIQRMSDNYMKYLYELFEGLKRKGPGSTETTLKALGMVPALPENPTILDVGCGSGPQTLVLAEHTGGSVIAVDNYQPFLDELARSAKSAGLSDRIKPVMGDMADLGNRSGPGPGLEPASFDLIWSEGALYIMGLEAGLQAMAGFLRPGGCLALSECVWLTDDRPVELTSYWNEAYPDMRDVEGCLKLAAECGYEVLGHFPIEKQCWTDFHAPLKDKAEQLREKYPEAEEAQMVVDEQTREIGLFEKHPGVVGYLFMVLKK